MAKNEVRNGQAEYGIVHVVEEQMRADGDGVFAARSSAKPAKTVTSDSAPARKAKARK